MKKFMKIMGIATLMKGMTTGAIAQKQTQETKARQEAAQKRIDEAKNNQ